MNLSPINLRRAAAAAQILALAAALAAGCGEGDSAQAIANADPESTTLSEFGEMYSLHAKQHGKPPEDGKPLMEYVNGYSSGSMAIQNGTIGVYWGAPIEKGSTAILAYDAEAPKAGGVVLLQDGSTIRRLTAEEFQAAPKAPGKLGEPGKPKSGRKKSG